MINIKDRLQSLMDERFWSLYRLSQETGISWSTLRNMFERNTEPSIYTLERICKGLGITITQFLEPELERGLTCDQKELLQKWSLLDKDDQALVLSLVNNLGKKKS